VIGANPFEDEIAFTNIWELQGQAEELTDRIISVLGNNPQDPEVQELRDQRRQLWEKIEQLGNGGQVGSSGAVNGFISDQAMISRHFGGEVFSAEVYQIERSQIDRFEIDPYQIDREFLEWITRIN
jgi:hypothetical protein